MAQSQKIWLGKLSILVLSVLAAPMRMVMLSHFQKNKQSSSVPSSNNMESPVQLEQLDDRPYTESFDDIIAICPRTYLTPQERYEFNKNNKPSLTRTKAVKM
jgi:hypothetical protein